MTSTGRHRRDSAILAALLAFCLTLAGCAALLGPEPPDSLKQAATDADWATKQIADLPKWTPGSVTAAWFFRPGAERVRVDSGKGDALANYANAILKGSQVFNPDRRPGPFAASWHAEVKAAAYMRKNVLSYAVLVINNTGGVCGEGQPEGCTTAAPIVLPEGYRLVVWWPDQQGSAQGPNHLDGTSDR